MSNSTETHWILIYPTFHLIWFLLSMCFCSNLWSLNYFYSRFKISQHLVFTIHFVDLVVSVLLPGLFLVILIWFRMGLWISDSSLCYTMYFTVYTPITLAPFCSALIALLRLKSLQLAKGNKELAKTWYPRSILPLFLLYVGLNGALFFIHIHLNWPISFTTESCLYGGAGRNLRLETRLMNLWMFIPQLASIVGDVKIVLLLRSHRSEVFSTRSVSTRRDQLRNSITTVPVRATAMATGFFLVYIFGAAVTNLVGLDVTSKAIALVIIGCFVNTLRHPLVALTTFRVFEEKEKRMQEIQRQKNLKREIEFARSRRLADQKVFVVDVETKF